MPTTNTISHTALPEQGRLVAGVFMHSGYPTPDQIAALRKEIVALRDGQADLDPTVIVISVPHDETWMDRHPIVVGVPVLAVFAVGLYHIVSALIAFVS